MTKGVWQQKFWCSSFKILENKHQQLKTELFILNSHVKVDANMEYLSPYQGTFQPYVAFEYFCKLKRAKSLFLSKVIPFVTSSQACFCRFLVK